MSRDELCPRECWEREIVLSYKLSMYLSLLFPSKEAVMGRDAWLGYKSALCSVWRRGSCRMGGAGSPHLVLAAFCTVGKNSLINALAWVRESQGEQSRKRLD